MIDTLNIAKEFQMVGFSQAQSEMMATQMVQIHQNNQYATKADLKALGQEMHLELKSLEIYMDGKIQNMDRKIQIMDGKIQKLDQHLQTFEERMHVFEHRIVFRLGAIVVGATTAMMFFERFLN